MTITPEERQQWRAAESPYSLDKRITRRLDALEKAEDDVEAAQIGQIAAYKLAEDDAAEEIGRLKERDEKAQARIEQLEAVAEAAKNFTTKYPDWGHYPVLRLVTKALRAAGYEV